MPDPTAPTTPASPMSETLLDPSWLRNVEESAQNLRYTPPDAILKLCAEIRRLRSSPPASPAQREKATVKEGTEYFGLCPHCNNSIYSTMFKDGGLMMSTKNREANPVALPASPAQPANVGGGETHRAEKVAQLFHDTYERLAPSFGYETREDTKQFDPTSPNGRLMIAVCGEIEQRIRLAAFGAGMDAGLREGPYPVSASVGGGAEGWRDHCEQGRMRCDNFLRGLKAGPIAVMIDAIRHDIVAALASPTPPQPAEDSVAGADPSVGHDALTITSSVETARATNESAHARSASATQPAEAETGVVEKALRDCVAFIVVMFGDVDGAVPETVNTPLQIPVKVGSILSEAEHALASLSGGEAGRA